MFKCTLWTSRMCARMWWNKYNKYNRYQRSWAKFLRQQLNILIPFLRDRTAKGLHPRHFSTNFLRFWERQLPFMAGFVQKMFKSTSQVKWNTLLIVVLIIILILTLSWRRPISYRNQSIDFRSKSMDWFLYDIGLCHERFKDPLEVVSQN